MVECFFFFAWFPPQTKWFLCRNRMIQSIWMKKPLGPIAQKEPQSLGNDHCSIWNQLISSETMVQPKHSLNRFFSLKIANMALVHTSAFRQFLTKLIRTKFVWHLQTTADLKMLGYRVRRWLQVKYSGRLQQWYFEKNYKTAVNVWSILTTTLSFRPVPPPDIANATNFTSI